MTRPTDDKLEAMAVRQENADALDRDALLNLTDSTAAMLRACKGRDTAGFETGLNTALKCIASLGYGRNEDVEEGHEDGYRAVETCLKDWKANKPAALDLAPDHYDWNAAIEAAIDEIDCGCDGLCLYPHACPKEDVKSIRALKKGSHHD